MWKRRIDLLPLINPPPSSRFRGCPAARATWGDVCSLARRISWLDESGACMKPDLGVFVSGSKCPFVSRPHLVTRDAMGIHGNQQVFMGSFYFILFFGLAQNKM